MACKKLSPVTIVMVLVMFSVLTVPDVVGLSALIVRDEQKNAVIPAVVVAMFQM
jgi:hypothetical protein